MPRPPKEGDPRTVAGALKILRTSHGIRLRELPNMSKSHGSNVENRVFPVTEATLASYAVALGMTDEELRQAILAINVQAIESSSLDSLQSLPRQRITRENIPPISAEAVGGFSVDQLGLVFATLAELYETVQESKENKRDVLAVSGVNHSLIEFSTHDLLYNVEAEKDFYQVTRQADVLIVDLPLKEDISTQTTLVMLLMDKLRKYSALETHLFVMTNHPARRGQLIDIFTGDDEDMTLIRGLKASNIYLQKLIISNYDKFKNSPNEEDSSSE